MAGAAGVSKPTCIFQILLAQAKKGKIQTNQIWNCWLFRVKHRIAKESLFWPEKKKKKGKDSMYGKKNYNLSNLLEAKLCLGKEILILKSSLGLLSA